jgi:hypothetical protein
LVAQSALSTWPLSWWIATSLVLATLIPTVTWLLTRSPLRIPALVRIATWPGSQAVAWLLAGLFCLLIPVAAWRAGILSPYYMGLVENDWLDALGTGGGLAVLIAALMLAGWFVYRRSLRSEPFAAWACCEELTPAERWVAPLNAGLGQWHWAFYRAGAIAWLAAGVTLPLVIPARLPWLAGWAAPVLDAWHAQPVYWGSWLGLGLVALEWFLNPYTWHELWVPGRLEGALRGAGLAVATTALFALTRSFWLCIACSLVVEIVIAGWFPVTTAEARTE